MQQTLRNDIFKRPLGKLCLEARNKPYHLVEEVP